VTTTDRWTGGDDYELWIGRWSRPVGAAFVDWLGVAPRGRWVDVGCGTGALSQAILERADPARVTGIDPSVSFVEHAHRHVVDPRVTFAVGSADALPLEDGSADAIVAGLVLNFVPDLGAALAEMRRVAAQGAIVGGYVWDYAGRMELIRRFFDAAVSLDPTAANVDEGVRFPLCAPEPLRAAFVEAGLGGVEVRSIDVPTVFADFDDYWAPFLGGVGPAPVYATSLSLDRRDALRERLRAELPIEPDGSIHLIARAWAVRGRAT
jgi:SAM-dependent methyltransferase